ncbi:energy transducer TonB [Pseudoduganella sp. GCM10020061]|uniref:energy transducer TonB n=1 Tax=Pseudoduganella sp. GCM10020061 TaxID=3317345 RepID=UPI0036406771
MTSAVAGSHYQVPPEPSRLSAIVLAVVMHAGLLFFLWFGTQWQATEEVAMEAEVWSVTPEMAAPLPQPVQAEPEVKPEPEPEPPPQKVEEPVAQTPPDIALEREKKRKEDERKKAEQLAKQEQLKKEQQEKLEKERLAKEAKLKADKLAKAKAAEEKQLKALRDEEMRRLTEAAGSGGSGTAARSAAPKSDPGYIASLTAKIKGNIIYGGNRDVPGDPRAVYRIEQLPTGEIISFRKIKSSGIPEYDLAVEQAITASSPLPKKKNGTVERTIEPIFRLKE